MGRDFSAAVRCAGAGWGAARVALGVVAIAAPPVASRPWVGRDVETPGGTVFAKALGVRDIALGGGTALAALSGRGFAGWALASAAADVGDTLVTRQHWPDLPRTRVAVAALASLSAAAGVVLTAADAVAGRRTAAADHH